MAVSVDYEVLFVGVLIVKALLIGGYVRAPDKLPFSEAST